MTVRFLQVLTPHTYVNGLPKILFEHVFTPQGYERLRTFGTEQNGPGISSSTRSFNKSLIGPKATSRISIWSAIVLASVKKVLKMSIGSAILEMRLLISSQKTLKSTIKPMTLTLAGAINSLTIFAPLSTDGQLRASFTGALKAWFAKTVLAITSCVLSV